MRIAALLVPLMAVICSSLHAEELTRTVSFNSPFPFLMQGEQRQISEDLVAFLENDTLELTLQDQGLAKVSNEQYMVSLIQPSGQRIDQRPSPEGKLVFQGVEQGLAALVVTADSLSSVSTSALYAAIPFFISPAGPGDSAPGVELPLAKVEPTSLAQRIEESGTEPSEESEILPKSNFDTVSNSSKSRFKVQRLADGSVQGQVIAPQAGYLAIPGVTRITLQKDGQPILTTFSAETGEFVAERVPLGIVSMIASGPAGHAAHSIEIVEFEGVDELKSRTTGLSNNGSKYVARLAQTSGSLLICLIPPALMDEVREVRDDRLPGGPEPIAGAPGAPGAPAAPAGGGFAGPGGAPGFGGGAGGGGSFGGGGLGAFGGIGAIAAVAALADDDDGFNSNAASGLSP